MQAVATIPALVTLCTSLGMGLYLLMRRHKELLHWMLIGVLASLTTWTAGVLGRFTATTPEALGVSLKIIFTSILACSAFWLLAAVIYSRRSAALRPALSVAVLACTSVLALALFTNEGHRLFLRRVDFAAVEAGPGAYVGPLFWVFVAWVYGCVGGGAALYLRAAGGVMRRDSRRRGLLLALAALVPVATSTVYTFQLLPVRFDLTPSGLMVTMVLLSLAVFRYQLLDSLPLAREALVAHLDDGVVMAGAGGRITDWNPAAARILGEGTLQRGALLSETLAQVGASQEGRVVDVATAVVAEEGGAPSGEFAILSDRSEFDRIERSARQAQRLEIVGALAAGVGHEINDPLTFVRANLVEIERLGRRVEAASAGAAWGDDAALAEELADLRAVAQETLEGVDRMHRIVEDMRRLSLGDLRDFAPLDLARVVDDALRLACLDGDDGVDVDVALGEVVPVRGNADALVQVVLNLLVNARQALAGTTAPRIALELRRCGPDVELRVRDNGPGVPAELSHRIFDPFFTTRAPDEGTGLGLAIAFDIAREHGGVLEQRGEPGGGACFALRLPVAGPDAGGGPGSGGGAGGPGPGRQVEAHRQ